MARKKLNDLAKIGLGLAAAYGASKVLGQKSPMEIAKLEGAEADINAMEGPARRSMYAGPQSSIDIARREAKDSVFNQMEGADRESMTASAMSPRGSVEAFKADDAARKARIEALRGSQMSDRKMALSEFDEKVRNYNRSMVGAKKGKMIKASKGGSVVARGNKIARSKPTKLF
jgi:hypothetical protein